MTELDADNLTDCHICFATLVPHPLYLESGSKYCPDDGDFLVQRLRGQKPTVTFIAFEPELPKVELDRSTYRFRMSMPNELPPQRKLPEGMPAGRRLSIRCDQTGDIYYTSKAAAEALGVSRPRISHYLNGKARHVKGYTFTVIDWLQGDPPPFVPKPFVQCGHGYAPKSVRCNENNITYPTIRDAARSLGINHNGISVHLNNPEKRPNVGGYTFVLVPNNKR